MKDFGIEPETPQKIFNMFVTPVEYHGKIYTTSTF